MHWKHPKESSVGLHMPFPASGKPPRITAGQYQEVDGGFPERSQGDQVTKNLFNGVRGPMKPTPKTSVKEDSPVRITSYSVS